MWARMGGEESCSDFADESNYAKVRHGRWIEEEPAVYKCSECGFTFTTGDPIEKFVYCRCGAKMDLEVNDEQ